MSGAPVTRWFSLGRRLLGWLLAGTTVGWAAAIGLSYVDAHHEIDELFDAQMVQQAQTLLALAAEYDDDDDVARLDLRGHRYLTSFVFQLWDGEGRLLLRSANTGQAPLTRRAGFSEAAGAGGSGWRYYSQWDTQHELRAIVGEAHAVREDLSGQVAQRLLLPALSSIPLLGAWIWFVTWRGLRPLGQIADALGQRDADRLEPLRPPLAPVEVKPLIDALDSLFGRLARSLEQERRFTADAAHELRTPLAAMATQAQVARRARDEAEREHALAQIEISGRRAARLVDQLLTLARLDPAAGAALPLAPVALDALAGEVCAEQGVAALAKGIDLELEVQGPAHLQANADLLRALLRNLVDNALRYTPEGGAVKVTVGPGRLRVADTGPGIPEQQRQAALQRFKRLAEQSVEGSGLGLSIVARIAELHGMTLALDDGRPGLVVELTF